MAAARTAFSLKFSQVTQREEGVWGWHEVTEWIRMIKLLKGLRCQTIYTAFLYSTLRRLCVCVYGAVSQRDATPQWRLRALVYRCLCARVSMQTFPAQNAEMSRWCWCRGRATWDVAGRAMEPGGRLLMPDDCRLTPDFWRLSIPTRSRRRWTQCRLRSVWRGNHRHADWLSNMVSLPPVGRWVDAEGARQWQICVSTGSRCHWRHRNAVEIAAEAAAAVAATRPYVAPRLLHVFACSYCKVNCGPTKSLQAAWKEFLA